MPPWSEWEHLSKKGHARDTIFSDCGHTFFQIPYTVDYLIKSKISLEHLNCQFVACKAVDEFFCETDTNYISQCLPPNVRPVNRTSAMVLNEEGVVQGPFTFH